MTITSKSPQSIGNSTIGETAVVSHYKLDANGWLAAFPVSTLNRITIGSPTKRQPNGVSLAGR